jgi:small-conductance mechanosensitive channel
MPSASVEIVGSILFWVVILFFVAAATQILGLAVFTAWLKDLMAYLPTLLAGLLIIAAGVLLSGLAREVTIAALPALPEPQRRLLGRIVQGILLMVAVVVGADQIGIKVTFLAMLAAVIAGAVIGGLALAVSLGARSFVSNLIGAHYLRQAFSIGQRVRVGGFEGRILDLTPVSIVLEAEDGRVTLPAKVFNEEPIVLLVARSKDA